MKEYSETRDQSKYRGSIKNKRVRIAYQCWFINLGIILLALSISSYSSFQYTIENYKYVILNWNQQPIVDIKITNEGCSQEEEALVEYVWPGTIDGCECYEQKRALQEIKNQQKEQSNIIVGQKCNQTQLNKGCKTINSQDIKRFNLFPSPNNKTGFQLCAKREIDNNFYSWIPKGKDCKDGLLKCGENEDEFYCTAEKQCPIRRIGLKGKINLENEEEANSLGLDTLIYSRNSSGYLPIVEFRIGQGGVCLRNNEYGISDGRDDYPLMIIKRKECQYDTRFEEVTFTTEDVFYNINGLSNLTETLTGYQISKQAKWGLYQRSYIPWKMKCRGQEFNQFLLQQIYLNEIFDGLTSQLILSVFFFIIISVSLSSIAFMNILGKQIPFISTNDSNETSQRIFYIELGVKFVLYVPYATLISLEFSQIQKELDFFERIINLNCSDNYLMNQIEQMKDSLLVGVSQMNSAQFYLFFITILIDMVYIGFICYQKRQSKIV
ncbi:unnamed protein product [Paramecium sonneborni]|uniref:Transmembrane protein n=1 Tax=Paramecium sonneborni TaxID=65129 RepID=A0A8S1K740_9CILI|nr:unnamed protein product [Paramecium sonneborni]